MVLRDKLHNNIMSKGEGIATCLTRITQLRDEMVVVGGTIPNPKVVHIDLNGFTQ